MSLFSSIKNAIFGEDQAESAAPAAAPAAAAAAAAPAAAPVRQPIDVEAVLAAKPGADKLNWRTSVADLMRLVDMDPSLDNRKELAKELGYEGPLDGSADMNIRLHRAIMKALSLNGGVVPPQMMD